METKAPMQRRAPARARPRARRRHAAARARVAAGALSVAAFLGLGANMALRRSALLVSALAFATVHLRPEESLDPFGAEFEYLAGEIVLCRNRYHWL